MLQVVSLPKDGPMQKPLAHVGFKSWNLSQAAGERCSKEKEALVRASERLSSWSLPLRVPYVT